MGRVVVGLLAVLSICCLIAGSASAERLILIPTGTTLGTGDFRAECAAQESRQAYWAGTGIIRLEIEGAWFHGFGPKENGAVSAQISVLPETSFTPAVGLGVRDIGDSTDKSSALYDGRSVYLAVSKGVPTGESLGFVSDLKLHAGIGTGSLSGIFFGAEATLPGRVCLAAEYDTKEFNLAATYSAAPVVKLRVSSIHDDVYFGVLASASL
jgi:hypothetical protein